MRSVFWCTLWCVQVYLEACVVQMNTFPERGTVYDFCFEKKANGQWIDWMDTVDKHYHHITPTSKVCRYHTLGFIHISVLGNIYGTETETQK